MSSVLTVSQKIARITQYQQSACVHPLTCHRPGCRSHLEPIAEGERVVLRCPAAGCDYRQEHIPSLALADPSLYSPPWRIKPGSAPSGGSTL